MNSKRVGAKRLLTAIGLAIGLALTVTSANAQAAPKKEAPAINQYAWGFDILTRQEATFYRVELPLEVHQSVSDPQLRDAGVYNSAGYPVPRVFRPTEPPNTQSRQETVLPLLALREGVEESPDQVRLRFRRNGNQTSVDFDTTVAEGNLDEVLSGYIVDTREFEPAVKTLQLNWPEPDQGFIGQVQVDSSNDLTRWQRRGSGAIADLKQEQTHVLRSTLDITHTADHFLRIRWQGMPDSWKLSSVKAVSVTRHNASSRRLTQLTSSARADDGGYLFDLQGAPQVDSLRVVLDEANTMVTAGLFYWQLAEQRWQPLGSDSHYLLGRGDNTLSSPARSFRPTRAARFKLLITKGQTGTAPSLEIGWLPDTLTFLAQGEPPFTLAVGRRLDADADFPQQRLFADSTIVSLADGNRAAEATLDGRRALGGPKDLNPAAAFSWRKPLLWAGLAVGVLFVALMAVRVIRDLSAQTDS